MGCLWLSSPGICLSSITELPTGIPHVVPPLEGRDLLSLVNQTVTNRDHYPHQQGEGAVKKAESGKITGDIMRQLEVCQQRCVHFNCISSWPKIIKFQFKALPSTRPPCLTHTHTHTDIYTHICVHTYVYICINLCRCSVPHVCVSGIPCT